MPLPYQASTPRHMKTDHPQNTLRLSRLKEDQVSGLHYLFHMRREGIRQYLANASIEPSEELVQEAAQVLSECVDFLVPVEFVRQLLSMYPPVRINLAMVGSAQDSEVRDRLVDAMSHFLLGCTWPTYGDQVDAEEFSALLKRQYFLLREGM